MKGERQRSIDRVEGASTFEDYVKNTPLVLKAWRVASQAHEGQFRKEGAPYFTHCTEVAKIIYEEWGIKNSPDKVAAALLHDTVEDTDLTLEYINKEFGEEVAFLVEGVSKFRSDKVTNGKSADKETVRKIFDRTLINPWVALLKLADRLHNMRTLNFMPPEKRVAKAKETLSYAKLAESLGMWKVMIELEDLSLKFTNPDEYTRFSHMLKEDPRTSELFIGYTTSKLDNLVKSLGIDARIEIQTNGIARIRHKMIREHRFSKINDVVSFRIITDDSESTQKAENEGLMILGTIWANFGEMEDSSRFDNFLYKARDNGYSAIQLTLDYPFSSGKRSFEVAITTSKREDLNNHGVLSLIRSGQTDITSYTLKLIFTPSGEVKFLRPEATGLDFAYSIEKHMGAQATGIFIDGVEFPISTIIPNASTVDVIVGPPRAVPDAEAVNYVLPPARKAIEDQRAEFEDQETISKGKSMVREVLAKRGLFDIYDLIRFPKHSEKVTRMLRHLGAKRYVSNLYRMIGLGQLGVEDLDKAMDEFHLSKDDLNLNSIRLEGDDVKDLLGFIGKVVGKYGGNIKPMINEPYEDSGKDHFRATLIVENLPSGKIRNLERSFLRNPAIKKVVIV